jgi:zinc protease
LSAPAPGSPPRTRLPFGEAVHRRTLANRAELYVLENHFNPTVALSGSVRAGPIYADPNRRLVASAAAGELLKGTARRSKLQLARDLESRAATLSFSADASDPVGVDAGGAALSRDLDLLLDAFAEVLCSPVFPEEELARERVRLVGVIRQQEDQTSIRAYQAASRRLYPPGHPMRRRSAQERIADIESLRREDLLRFYEERYGASTLRVVVVGDLSAERTLDGLERRLSAWRSGPDSGIPECPVPPPAPGSETVVMRDKASADVVLLQPAGLTRPAPDYLACLLANAALGQSSLTSRLGTRVRDREGLTYGVHSSFSATHVPGPFVVSLTVRPENRDAALEATLDEISRFLREGLTERELSDEKSSRIGKFKVDLASNAGIAQALDAAVYYGLGVGYLDEFPARIAAITKEEADGALRAHIGADRFTIVSAGDF